ncbi:MAG: hypothetical protein JST59_21880 [Actinobacteria bacterium]|nr:hypothetical protein [Actinomycetota bacterium]
MRHLTRRLTYANVVTTLALFLAIGGGAAFAATNLAKNSVGPKAIKANAVGPAKIKAGAVTNEKLANGAVTESKLAAGAVGATQLGAGQVGATQLAAGAVGAAQLAAGAVGGSKLGTINTRTASVSVPKGEIKGLSVSCSTGETLLGGGTSWNTTGPEQLVYTSESNKSAPTTWHAAGVNAANVPLTFNVFAYCIAG